jgi:hypothetical protein
MVPPPHNTSERDFAALIERLVARYRISPEDADSIEPAFRAAMEYAESLGAQSRQSEVAALKDGLLTCKRTLESTDPGRSLFEAQSGLPLLQYVDWALDSAKTTSAAPRPSPNSQARWGFTQWLQRWHKSPRY